MPENKNIKKQIAGSVGEGFHSSRTRKQNIVDARDFEPRVRSSPEQKRSGNHRKSTRRSQRHNAGSSSVAKPLPHQAQPQVPDVAKIPPPFPPLALPLQAAQGSCAPLRSSYPFIGHDVFRDLCNVVYDPHKDFKLTVPSLVFLHYPHFNAFGAIVDSLEYDVVLVSNSNVDRMIPYSTSDQEPNERAAYTKILQSPKVISWYGVNLVALHPKLKHLPLGNKWNWRSTDYHSEDGHKGSMVAILAKLAANPAANFELERANLLFAEMTVESSDYANYAPSKGHRRVAVDAAKFATRLPKSVQPIKTRICANAPQHVTAFESYLWTMRQYKFVLSPVGVGIDCHRTWEALMMGAIPVVESIAGLNPIYEGLPVLIVEDWRVLNETFLNEAYAAMRGKQYQWEKLFAPYYVEKMLKDLLRR